MKRPLLLPILFGSLLACLMASRSLLANKPETAYSPPRDIAEEWAFILSLVVIIAAAATIVYTLVTRRKRLTDLHSKWLLFLGIGVLPVPAILMSTAVGLEHSKKASFCNSCHAMDPFIDDMRDADSDLLAAAHFRNRLIQKEHCYTCHTDYGIFGTMEAKLSGLGHIWKDASGRWHHPIEISKPYQFRICLSCHAGAARFERLEDHEGVIEGVVDGDMGCTDCHELAHPARSERSAD
jgi:nitrate/TMAO reductase-like tetraheme cytochrome c subunit